MNLACLRRYVLLGITACSTGVSADEYHYNNMLIGDRASGLGGAYTAIADDATGLFYNPAGITYSRGRNLTASVNAYHITNIAYKDVLGGDDWNRESASLLPNFFGVVQPLGGGVAGFSYAVTDSIQENLDQRFALAGVDDYIINLNNSDSTYKLGASYALEINKKLSVGATMYVHYRTTETVMNQIITGIDSPAINGTYQWLSGYSQSTEYGFEPVLGVMWTPLDRLAFGATVRHNSIFSSKIESQATCATDIDETTPSEVAAADLCHSPSTGAGLTTPTSLLGDSTEKRVYPTQITIGAAYFPTDRLLFAGDFSYYTAAEGVGDENDGSTLRSKASTWNASFGAEYYFSNAWALRGGIYTNNANTPTLESDLTDQPDHVNLVGISASLSRFTRQSSITAGFSYASGSGEAQIVGGTTAIQDVSVATTTLFLSTSYNY